MSSPVFFSSRMLVYALSILTFININVISGQNTNLKKLKIVSEWSSLDYVFPTPEMRVQAISNGLYVPSNGVPIDVDVDYQDNKSSRIFITIPRFTTGIPVTLGYISGSGNLIAPYPDYTWHSSHGRDCDGITSVFRIAVSTC